MQIGQRSPVDVADISNYISEKIRKIHDPSEISYRHIVRGVEPVTSHEKQLRVEFGVLF